MNRIPVRPALLRWARERAGRSTESLRERFPNLDEWERGASQPTLKQLERFARAVHTPIGYLFLPEPPVERVPIPDFRTIAGKHIARPSPDLLETIYICQQRQEWFREYLRWTHEDALSFVASVAVTDPIEQVATAIRELVGLDLDERKQIPTWTDALRRFIHQADASGVLVMVSGVVLNNNRRRLDPDEFRGLALVDAHAPLVFINGADSKAAQMFTLAHELAHVWLGQSALSDSEAVMEPTHRIERWCNRVAAEVLVPLSMIREEYRARSELRTEMDRLARRFKVSTLVILRRIHDSGGLTANQLESAYRDELERLRAIPRGSGGNFYLTQASRLSRRFARAVVSSTLEGSTLHRDALRMLGFSKLRTFHELGRSVGVSI